MAQSLWAENLTGLPCDCASELWPQGMLAAHLHVIVGSGIEPIVQSREAIWLASARFTIALYCRSRGGPIQRNCSNCVQEFYRLAWVAAELIGLTGVNCLLVSEAGNESPQQHGQVCLGTAAKQDTGECETTAVQNQQRQCSPRTPRRY